MGLNAAVLDLLATHCRRSEPGSALVAGYPDVLVSAEDMARIMGTSEFPRDANEAAIVTMHGGLFPQVYDAAAVFDALGYKLNVVDINKTRGCERVLDLNYSARLQPYDLVLDHGTVEHVWNIGEAALSLARAVRMGGFLVMHLPLVFMAHGFYNIEPEWYRALCAHCGFDILFHEAWSMKHGYLGLDVRRRFPNPPDHTLMTMVARRVRDGLDGYPIQDQYR